MPGRGAAVAVAGAAALVAIAGFALGRHIVTSGPGLYANLPLPGQEGQPFVWDNTDNPIMVTQAPNQGGTLFKFPNYVPGAFGFPPAGRFAIVTKCVITIENGPTEGGATIYFRPQFPEFPGRGDGPYAAAAFTIPPGETATHSGEPGAPPGPSPGNVLLWNAPVLWTPSIEGGVLASAGPGAKITFHVEGTLYTMQAGQAEVVFNELGGIPPGGPNTVLLGTVPAGMVWIPALAEVNPSAGGSVGDRQAALFFGGGGVLASGVVLAMTAVESTPDNGNNNVTGSYVTNGSAPGDKLNHTLFPPKMHVPPGNRVWRWWEYQVGDSLHYCAVFLQSPR
jgi:hypothetical protein